MKLFIVCLIIIVGLAAALILQQPNNAATTTQYELGLPWQITLTNGNSSVFGLSPGTSTLNEAITQLGDDHELALLAKPNQLGSLELYFSHFKTGPIQGKLIITADIPEADILAIKNNPSKQEYLENGTKKFRPNTAQRETALKRPIKSITLAPDASIDETVIHDRFGSPTQLIKMNHQISLYVYETLGLAVRIDSKGKDMLHYVSPTAMPELIGQLHAVDGF